MTQPPAPLTQCILGVNIVVAVVSAVAPLLGFADPVQQWLPLTLEGVRAGRLWELFTYMWVHAPWVGAGPLHLICNMLALASFGRVAEWSFGVRHTCTIYLAGGMAGAVCFIVEMLLRESAAGAPGPGTAMMGASAAVCALVAAVATLHPRSPVQVLFIPVSFPALRVVQVFAAISALLIVLPLFDFLAHGAHLGGLIAGGLYVRFMLKPYPEPAAPRVVFDEPVPSEWEQAMDADLLEPDEFRRELDRVLDKRLLHGPQALTPRDRRILELGKDRL